MNSPIWSALYYGGVAVIVAVSRLPGWVMVFATVAVWGVYGLHLRFALRMLDDWYARVDRDAG